MITKNIEEDRPSDFDEIYNSVKDSPEAVEELNGIMEDTIERMRALVEKHEALNGKDPASVTEDELVALTKEEYKIEEDRKRIICENLCRKFTDDESFLENEMKNAFPRVCCLEIEIEHMTGKLVNES